MRKTCLSLMSLALVLTQSACVYGLYDMPGDESFKDRREAVNVRPTWTVTIGVKTYVVIPIFGKEFKRWERNTHNILNEAKKRGYQPPTSEVMALLRDKFTQNELGYHRVIGLLGREPYANVRILESDNLKVSSAVVGSAGRDFLWNYDDVFVFLAPGH